MPWITESELLPFEDEYFQKHILKTLDRGPTLWEDFVKNSVRPRFNIVEDICVICHDRLDPWNRGILPTDDEEKLRNYKLMSTEGCRHQFHQGCMSNMLQRGTTRCPTCKCRWFYTEDEAYAIARVNRYRAAMQTGRFLQHGDLMLNRAHKIDSDKLSIGILLAARHLYEQHSSRLNLNYKADNSSDYWPWGVAAHGDGRHVVEGLVRAARKLKGEDRTIADLHHILPVIAQQTMQEKSPNWYKVWTHDMETFASHVTVLGVNCYCGMSGYVNHPVVQPTFYDRTRPTFLFEGLEEDDVEGMWSDESSLGSPESNLGWGFNDFFQEHPSPEPAQPEDYYEVEEDQRPLEEVLQSAMRMAREISELSDAISGLSHGAETGVQAQTEEQIDARAQDDSPPGSPVIGPIRRRSDNNDGQGEGSVRRVTPSEYLDIDLPDADVL